MRDLRVGFWDLVDQSLRWIGRGATWLLTGGRVARVENAAAYAVIGGALVCAIFGGIVGFVLSNFFRNLAIVGGTAIGLLLGACAGVFFGSFVEAVDEQINNVLASLKSK